MAHFHNDGFDYLEDDMDMTEFYDDFGEDMRTSRRRGENDYEFENDFDMNEKDTTAIQARRGKDIQGIPWGRLNHSREKYRETRLQSYKNYSNLARSCNDLDKDCKPFKKGRNFYDFHLNTRTVKPTIVHFQSILDNDEVLIRCHDLYLSLLTSTI